MNNNIILLLIFILTLFILCQYQSFIETFTNGSNENASNNENVNRDLILDITNTINRAHNIEIPKVNNNSLNDTIRDLLNDIKTKKDEVFKLKQDLQNKKINEVTKQIDDIEKHIGRTELPRQNIKTIKSLDNGMDMSTIPLENNNQLIRVNDGCLASNAIGNYEIKSCNNRDREQQFNVVPIYSPSRYDNNIEIGMAKLKEINNPGRINYPFSMIKSVANGNCLQNNYSRISVQPCQVKKSQRWQTHKEPKVCR